MPYVVHGNAQRILTKARERSIDYSYPGGLDLKPGSEQHNRLLSLIMERALAAHTRQSERFPAWRRIDRTLTAYQWVDGDESRTQEGDDRRPVSIVFPYSYAMMETLLTYLTVAFFQDPLFRYEGVGPEDTIGSMLLELDVRVQSIRNRHPLALHTFFRDCLAYGQGIITPVWEVQRRYRRGKKRLGLPGEPAPRESSIFEGNMLYNVDPYRYLPDPTVAVHQIQRGEYVGWTSPDNIMNMLIEEQDSEGGVFNVRYLQEMVGLRSVLTCDEADRELLRGGSMSWDPSTSGVDRLYLNVTLIPKEWELGDGEYPEKWLFSVVGDAVVVQAERLDFDHQKYPLVVGAPDFDGYSSSPISRLEILYGLQHVLDFLFNSHVANVRKAINDMLVIDPYLINEKDVRDPRPGKVIRMRRPAWGRGVKDAITQLQVADVTRGHVADSDWIVQWMQRIAAVDDSVMGVLRSGGPERLTQAEFQGTRGGAVSRLQRLAQVLSWQSMQELAMMVASHTQQFREEEQYLAITGDWQRRLVDMFGVGSQFPSRIAVSPDDLRIDYDVIPRDGSLPGGNFSSFWIDMYKIIATDPKLSQEFDTFRLFSYIAKEMGAKNTEEFRRQTTQQQAPTVMPNAQVEQNVQAGNLIPFNPQVGTA